jgi:hypothetical protein
MKRKWLVVLMLALSVPGEKRGHNTKLIVRLVRSTPNCNNAGRV